MEDDLPRAHLAVAQPTAVRRATLAQSELVTWFATTYGEVGAYLGAHGITPKGHPFARYHVRTDGRFDVEAGFPVPKLIAGNADVMPSALPAGWVAVLWHVGPYEQIGKAYATLSDWIRARGGTLAGDPWEIYHDPPAGDPAEWRTEVVQPFAPAEDRS
jgi:effector-binding domain-containing protein